DPSYGERVRETISVPDYSVNFNEGSIILQANQTKKIVLDVHSFTDNLQDTIFVECPEAWKVSATAIPVSIKNKHADEQLEITLTATESSERGTLILKNAKGEVVQSYTEIVYDHIPTQVIFRPAMLTCVKIDAKIIA